MATVTQPPLSESPDADASRPDAGRAVPGLSSTEAQRRLTEFGPNEIRRERATNSLTLLARQFASPVIWLLLAASVLAAFPNNAHTDPTAQDRVDAHSATLRRAIAYIDDHAHEPITVADIAAAAHVTVRTLQYAFRRHLDTTPLGYVRQVRLSHAHRDLLAAGPDDTSVVAVAARWGFPHPGRFASLYRDMYGISPSHTLRG